MELFIRFFDLVLYRPLFNLLVFFYQYLPGHDFGVSIIVLTVLIRILLYPLAAKSIKVQKELNEIQPKIQEIQKKYKDDKQEQVRLMMDLYKKEKINPFSGFLPILIQLPILIALYRVFWRGTNSESMGLLYGFLSFSGQINPFFLGIINLSKPSLYLAILAGVTQFWQAKILIPKNQKKPQEDKYGQFSNMLQKQMLYFLPVFTVLVLLKIPSAVALYWAVANLFIILQQYFEQREKKLSKDKIYA